MKGRRKQNACCAVRNPAFSFILVAITAAVAIAATNEGSLPALSSSLPPKPPQPSSAISSSTASGQQQRRPPPPPPRHDSLGAGQSAVIHQAVLQDDRNNAQHQTMGGVEEMRRDENPIHESVRLVAPSEENDYLSWKRSSLESTNRDTSLPRPPPPPRQGRPHDQKRMDDCQSILEVELSPVKEDEIYLEPPRSDGVDRDSSRQEVLSSAKPTKVEEEKVKISSRAVEYARPHDDEPRSELLTAETEYDLEASSPASNAEVISNTNDSVFLRAQLPATVDEERQVPAATTVESDNMLDDQIARRIQAALRPDSAQPPPPPKRPPPREIYGAHSAAPPHADILQPSRHDERRDLQRPVPEPDEVKVLPDSRPDLYPQRINEHGRVTVQNPRDSSGESVRSEYSGTSGGQPLPHALPGGRPRPTQGQAWSAQEQRNGSLLTDGNLQPSSQAKQEWGRPVPEGDEVRHPPDVHSRLVNDQARSTVQNVGGAPMQNLQGEYTGAVQGPLPNELSSLRQRPIVGQAWPSQVERNDPPLNSDKQSAPPPGVKFDGQPPHLARQSGVPPGYYGGPPPKQQTERPTGPVRRGPPPLQQRALPRRRRPPSLSERLWSGVEKGLDTLANLEDVVGGKAQQLLEVAKSSVLGSASSAENKNEDDILTSGNSIVPQLWKSRPTPRAPQPEAPPMDMSRFQKKFSEEDSAKRTQTPAIPVDRIPKNPYSVVMEQHAAVNRGDSGQRRELTPDTRKIEWTPPDTSEQPTTSRMIRANGGASSPPTGPSATLPSVLPPELASQNPFRQQQPGSLASGTLPRPVQPQTRRNPMLAAAAASSSSSSSSNLKKAGPRRPAYDSDSETWTSRITSALPRFPLRLNPFRRSHLADMYSSATLDAWKATDDDDDDSRKGIFGALFRSKRSKTKEDTSQATKNSIPEPLVDLMDRCENGKSASLLNLSERNRCLRIGRNQALMDMVTLSFFLIGLRQLPGLDYHLLPYTLLEIVTVTIPGFLNSFVLGMDTFAPFAFAAVFLSIQTRNLINDISTVRLVKLISASINEEVQYGALFLRLYAAGTSSGRDLPERLRRAAQAQVLAKVDSARLKTFVTFVLTAMILMTLSSMKPLLEALMKAVGQVAMLEQWTSWPLQWQDLGQGVVSSAMSFWETTSLLVKNEVSYFKEHPMVLVYAFSIAACLACVTSLSCGGRAVVVPASASETDADEDEEDELQQHLKYTEVVSNLGVSSSSRLILLSDNGGIDATLERWRQIRPRDVEISGGPTRRAFFHLLFKGVLSGFLLLLPLVVFGYVNFPDDVIATSFLPRWDSPFDLAILLMFARGLSWKTLSSNTLANDLKQGIIGFLSALASALQERSRILDGPPVNLQFHAAVSPVAGLVVKDLWAAHTSKRAWAVRGANLECRNGEILVILGDDSAGKSRLMTTLAEAMCGPPRRAQTTNRVRGSISIGNLDVTKWDHRQLRKRLGLVLNDARTMGDFSQILSSMTLDEILDPTGGARYMENLGPHERACVMHALKITGLYSTMLPKLPSKLSTVVTANEEDISRPSPLRPLYQLLSPAEWSKLFLSRVLSQMIYNNDNTAGAGQNTENCLTGTLLLLDDATLHLTEVEEARLLRELRKSGAATVLTSNRWATGRFADRITVMKDGAVVESGTHAELLNRGPQQSLYAAKWHIMTTQ